QWHSDLHFFGRFDDTMGNPLTTNNSTKDVDKDAFDVRVLEEDPKSRSHSLLGGATADVQKVCRFAACQLDHIHRRHGEARAVDHAADVAVQFHVVQLIFSRFDFEGVFFVEITHLLHIGMSEQAVDVERHLAVQRDEFLVTGNDQRINLDHGSIFVHEQTVEV